MPAAIIFDLYGTLIELATDSRPFMQIVRPFSAAAARDAMDFALTTPDLDLHAFAKQFAVESCDLNTMQTVLETDLRSARIFPDVPGTLKTLRSKGVRLAIVSNAAAPYKIPVVNLGLEDQFDAIVYSCDCGLRKPSPQIYKLALEALESSPDETLMVGDSVRSDVTGPLSVGISGIHLDRTGIAPESIKSLAQLVTFAT